MPSSDLVTDSSGFLSGTVTVTYEAMDTTSPSANQGIYTSEIDLGNDVDTELGNYNITVGDPIQVINSGDTIPGIGQGLSLTSPTVYAPINKSGQVVFVVNTASGQAVLVANPLSYIPPGGTLPSSYTPSDIRQAYGINNIPDFTNSNGQQVNPDGTGQTIAIVDAYNDPNIITDLSKFDNQFASSGLNAVPVSIFFSVYNQFGVNITNTISTSGQNGVPNVDIPTDDSPGGEWEGEEALDVEWAHAIAPGANIILVEANDDSSEAGLNGLSNLETAVNWAENISGASVLSLSFGLEEADVSNQTQKDQSPYNPPQGVTLVASTGDDGAPGGYPAYSPNVVAVGGTTLILDTSSGTIVDEEGWQGSGGGISTVEPQPTYQQGRVSQSTTQRTTPDVAFDGNPATGVLVYNSYVVPGQEQPDSFWSTVGGTSLGAPCWAGLIAIADQGRVLEGSTPLTGPTQTLPALYSNPQDFNDITTGNNNLYSCLPGYDLVTGLGSPKANLLVPALVAFPAITLNSVSTKDANELMVNYTVKTDLQSEGVQSFEIAIFRSDQPHYEANDNNNVEVASYQVTGDDLNEGPETITIDSNDGDWGMNANTLSDPLVPDPQLPYVLAVADPQEQLPPGVTTDSTQAYFRIYTIATVTHGQEFSNQGAASAPWVQSIVSGLQSEGFDSVIPVYWTSFPPAPGQTQAAGTDMYNQIVAAASRLSGLQENDIIDVQLIGHSRGASVIGVAMQDLITNPPNIPQLQHGYYEMTFLDPHPANSDTVNDVSLASLQALSLVWTPAEYATVVLDIGYFVASVYANDPSITVLPRVNQAQEYYQTNSNFALSSSSLLNSLWEAVFNLWGVPGQITVADPSTTLAYAVDLSSLGVGHGEVPLWYLTNLASLTNGSPPPTPPPPWLAQDQPGDPPPASDPSSDQLLVIPTSLELASGAATGVYVFAVTPAGNLDTSFNGTVTLALQNPDGATLGGTLTVNAVGGVADFTDVTIDTPGNGYVLQATSSSAASGSAQRLMSPRTNWRSPRARRALLPWEVRIR